MNTLLVDFSCVVTLTLSAGQTRWRLPATIETRQNVQVQSVAPSHQVRGVLYVRGDTTFTIKKRQRFLMVKVYGEGECRIRFENREYDVSSCPWLDGFADHQDDFFKVRQSIAKQYNSAAPEFLKRRLAASLGQMRGVPGPRAIPGVDSGMRRVRSGTQVGAPSRRNSFSEPFHKKWL